MDITQHDDPVAFERLVTPLLLRDEARYNLELAIVHRLATGDAFSEEPPLLLTVGDGLALRTPPYNMLVSAVPYECATDLADWVADRGIELPGAMGTPETVDAFAARYAERTGATARQVRGSGVYALTHVVEPRPVGGTLRLAVEADEDLAVRWWGEFAVEVDLRNEPADRARVRLRNGTLWLWDDGGPVCLVGHGGDTPHGARVGPVYTPPDQRGRGYASAATAALTQRLLDQGRDYTFLYTDLANPTSNKIYQAIGYEHVTDVIEVAFAR